MIRILLFLCALAVSARADQIASVSGVGNAALVLGFQQPPDYILKRAQVWSLQPWKQCCILQGNAARWNQYATAISRDGRFVALGCLDGTIEIYDARSGQLSARLGRAQQNTSSGVPDFYEVTALTFSLDGKTLASGNLKGVFLWNLRAKKLLFSRPILQRQAFYRAFAGPPRPAHLHMMHFSPDGKTLAIGGQFPFVLLFDVARKRVRRSLPLYAGEGGAAAVAFSPDGRRLLSIGTWNASGGSFDQFAMFNIRSGRALWRWDNHLKNQAEIAASFERVAFNSNGRRFAVASDSRLEMRNARSGRLIFARDSKRPYTSSLGEQTQLLPELAVR